MRSTLHSFTLLAHRYLAVLLLFLAFSSVAQEAQFDASDIRFNDGETVFLSGTWDFYPGVLPDEEGMLPKSATRASADLPGFWTDAALQSDSLDVGAYGVGTYQIRVALPERCPLLSLKMNSVHSSYGVWVNGLQVGGAGVLGLSENEAEPALIARQIPVPSGTNTLDITLAISNFEEQRGGGSESHIELGAAPRVFALWKRNLLFEAITATILLILALYHGILFFYYRQERSFLFFALMCLFGMLRQIMIGEMVINEMIPNFPYQLNMAFRYVGFFMGIAFGVNYVRALLSATFSKTIGVLAIVVGALFSVFVLLVPSWLAPYALMPFQLCALALVLYSIGVAVASVKHYTAESQFVLLGILVLCTAIGHDVLVAQGTFEPPFWQSFGFIAFVLTQVVLLAIRHRRVQWRTSFLSGELQVANEKLEAYNRNLEQKIVERTARVVQQKEQIESQNRELRDLHEFKTNFTSMLVHDLKNPINVILTNSKKGDPNDDRTLQIERSGKQMQQLVSNLLNLNKYEESKLVLSLADRDVDEIVRTAITQMQVFASEKSMKLVPDVQPGLAVYADQHLVERVLTNLISNAVKYGPFGSEVIISAQQKGDAHVEFSVADDGNGIKPEEQEAIFERNTSLQRSRVGHFRSTGLGLAFCQMVLDAHQGQIGVESEYGNGARFWFVLAGKYESFREAREHHESEEMASESEQQLSVQDCSVLAPVVAQIAEVPIYNVTRILELLEQLTDSTPAIEAWKTLMMNAIYNSNQEEFDRLLAAANAG